MPPFDDWNIIDEEEEEELQDAAVSASCQVRTIIQKAHAILP
jgi:hypothetical protein